MTKLVLDDEGSGSHAEIVAYVQRVIESRTTVNDDTTAARLARGITISVLSRLGFGYTQATGSARPAPAATPEDVDNAIAALRAVAEDEREPERYRESYARSLAAFEALRDSTKEDAP